MEFGTAFGLAALGDIGAVISDAKALDEAGFDFVSTAGHILTAPSGRYPDRPDVTYSATYRDPFVLFAHLAAHTTRIRFRTAILILPLYPTALVAKQAADVALLSGDRLELGVAISWQQAEYGALGQDVHTRGRRLSEQLEVLQLFWTSPYVTYAGAFHDIDGLGLGQLPTAPIPIWIGCAPQAPLLTRVVHHASGWLQAGGLSAPEPAALLAELARAEGRDPATIGIGGRVLADDGGPVSWIAQAHAQESFGATSITIAPPPDASREAGLATVINVRAVLASEFSP